MAVVERDFRRCGCEGGRNFEGCSRGMGPALALSLGGFEDEAWRMEVVGRELCGRRCGGVRDDLLKRRDILGVELRSLAVHSIVGCDVELEQLLYVAWLMSGCCCGETRLGLEWQGY